MYVQETKKKMRTSIGKSLISPPQTPPEADGRALPRSPFPQSLIPIKPSPPVTAFYQRQPPADKVSRRRTSRISSPSPQRTQYRFNIRTPSLSCSPAHDPSRDGAPTPFLRRERGLRPHGKGPGSCSPFLPPGNPLTDPAGARKHVRLPRKDRSTRPQRQWEVSLPLSPLIAQPDG